MNRRQFLAAASLVVGAPYVLKFRREAKAQALRIRRNLSTLAPNDPFFTQYAEAIRAMHQLAATDRRSWRGQALIHPDFCPHGVDGFILWHRHYINFFERICGSLIGNPNFALAYWDWSANNGRLPAPFFENGPLNVAFWNDRADYQAPGWGRINTRAIRGIAANRGLMDDPVRGGAFRPRALSDLLRQSNYGFFQSLLEDQPHNVAHAISGGNNGHMTSGLSSLDPIFWLHHCNVDRLTAQWQRAGNRIPQPNFPAYSRHFVDPQGAAQTVTAAQALDFASMGFTYDILAEQTIASREQPAPAAAPQARPMAAERDRPAPQTRPQSDGGERPAAQGSSDGLDIADEGTPKSGHPATHSQSEAIDDIINEGRTRREQPAAQGRPNTVGEEQRVRRELATPQAAPVSRETRIVGRGENAQPCSIDRAAQIAVSTEKFINDVISGRDRLRSPSAQPVAESRILARLSVGELKGEIQQCLVNVFVNARDLSPNTPADDPHYAGSFAFFGPHYAHQGGGTFLVDVSDVVRQQAVDGRLASENLDVQVLPVRADPNGQVQAQFVVSTIELISG